MKHNILVIMTIMSLSGCDKASALPSDFLPEMPLEEVAPSGESKTWQKIPKNWDYDQELVKIIKNAHWENVDAILYPLTSNNKINDALIYRLKIDILSAIENKLGETGEYTPEEWDARVKRDCKKENWIQFSEDEDENAKVEGVCENEEGFEEFLIYLVERVSNIDDPNIIEPIIDSLAIISGNQIPDSLTKFGDKAIKALITKYNETQDKELQSNIIFTLDRILQQNALVFSNNNEELKELFLKGIKNSDDLVRESAIEALMNFGDTSVIPALEEIAKNDNYVIHPSGQEDIYPVREKAQKAIDKLNGKP